MIHFLVGKSMEFQIFFEWNIITKLNFFLFPFNLTRKVEKQCNKKKIGLMELHLMDRPFQDAYSVHKKLGDTQKNIKRLVICMFI